MDSSAVVILLVVIALGILVQTSLLVAVVVTGRKMAGRLAMLERDLRPSLESACRAADNAALISERLANTMPQLEGALSDAAANVRRVTRLIEAVEGVVLRPLAPLAKGWAVVQGVRKGLSAWRRPPGLPGPGPHA
jgi:hypothetical protein